MKLKRKGFTVVELVIIIAVIGVLTAVLIPTFVGLTQRAERAENESFVRNINTQLAINEASQGKNRTAHDAMKDAEAMGFLVPSLTPVQGNDVVWDEESDRFAIVKSDYATHPDGNHIVYADANFNPSHKLNKLWKVYDAMPEEAKYSIYAKNTWSEAVVGDATNPLKVGFDAGDAEISNIYYGGEEGETVTIRTNGGRLTVNAKDDTVNHYGEGEVLSITAVAANSYHEYGYFPKASIAHGRLVVENGGNVEVVSIIANDVEIAKAETGDIGLIFKTADVTVDPVVPEGFTPTVASADEVSNFVAKTATAAFSTLEAAVEAVPAEGKITVLKDASMGNVVISKSLTIEGKGHELKGGKEQISTKESQIVFNAKLALSSKAITKK